MSKTEDKGQQGLNPRAVERLLDFAKLTGDGDVCIADLALCERAVKIFRVPIRIAYIRAKALGLLQY